MKNGHLNPFNKPNITKNIKSGHYCQTKTTLVSKRRLQTCNCMPLEFNQWYAYSCTHVSYMLTQHIEAVQPC